MKNFHVLTAMILALLLWTPAETAAQSTRTVTVVKADRPAKRKIRRKQRRVVRRTLRKLPRSTRAIAWRNVNYYPVRGRYYLARRGVYVRAFPPVGFRMRRLAVKPIRILVRARPYWYAEGVFYKETDGGYEVVPTPVGAVVPELPEEAEALDMDGITTYELNDAIYREVADGYEIIELLED